MARQIIEDPTELGYSGWGAGSIGEKDWKAIKKIIEDYNVTSILEVGVGLSTFLMSQMVPVYVGYDTLQRHLDWMKPRLLNHVELRLWDGEEPFDPGADFDMAFIDGPTGAFNRKPSFVSVLGRAEIICIHDAGDIWREKWRFKLDPKGEYKAIFPGSRFSAWKKRKMNG